MFEKTSKEGWICSGPCTIPPSLDTWGTPVTCLNMLHRVSSPSQKHHVPEIQAIGASLLWLQTLFLGQHTVDGPLPESTVAERTRSWRLSPIIASDARGLFPRKILFGRGGAAISSYATWHVSKLFRHGRQPSPGCSHRPLFQSGLLYNARKPAQV